jgi:hypothetical protein
LRRSFIRYFNMLKKAFVTALVVSLSMALLWRPAVPAVLENEQGSFLTSEAMPMALPEIAFALPQKRVVWFERLEERDEVRPATHYLVSSYERPPPWRG